MQTVDRLGEFILDREIGRGGMGVVYLARQQPLGRHVALKVLPFEFTQDAVRLERFHREAEVVSRLDHPNIVPVYGVGESDGVHYIAMKYVRGDSLDLAIRNRRVEQGIDQQDSSGAGSATQLLSPQERRARTASSRGQALPRRAVLHPEEASRDPALSESDVGWVFRCLKIAERIARALHHAHANGVIHRDVKPGNIILDQRGDPWLLDFGLVRDTSSGDKSLTATGGVIGTSYYLPPEFLSSENAEVDERADVYSLGVTLYEMVTLRRPFPYNTPDTLFHAIVNEDALPPRRLNPLVPRDLETVIQKAMEKDPERRYASAEELADDLRRVRSFEPIVARRVGLLGRFGRWVRRNPVLAGTLLFALLSFGGMVEYSIWKSRTDRRRAVEALEVADLAFEEGRRQEALDHYRLYLTMGGDPKLIAWRYEQLMRLEREEGLSAARSTTSGGR